MKKYNSHVSPGSFRYRVDRQNKVDSKRKAGIKFKPPFKDLYPVDNDIEDTGPKIGQVYVPSEPNKSFTPLPIIDTPIPVMVENPKTIIAPLIEVKKQPVNVIDPGPDTVTEVERVAIVGTKIKRDHSFRPRVLAAYGAKCVICGYDRHVDAAHLDPKHEINDDRTENGVPLCLIHHWEYDHKFLTREEVVSIRDGNKSESGQ